MADWIRDTVALVVIGAVVWSGFALTAAAQAVSG